MSFSRVLSEFEDTGILLASDRSFPSVVRIVAGPAVIGSWWGHRKGREIFRDLERLEAHPDSLLTRLVSGKVTYVHRRLWRDFLSVAASRERWQLKGLDQSARRLLASVAKDGEVRMDEYAAGRNQAQLRKAAREVEARLLVYSDEIHTERGSHTKVLSMWSRSPKLRDLKVALKDPAAARETFERLVDDLNARFDADGRLPWRQ